MIYSVTTTQPDDQHPETGDTALHTAAKVRAPKLVAMLSVFNVDQTVRNNDAKTAYDIAQEQGADDVVALLDAPKETNFEIDDNEGGAAADDEASDDLPVPPPDDVASPEAESPDIEESESIESMNEDFEAGPDEPPIQQFDTEQADAQWKLSRGQLISRKWSTRRVLTAVPDPPPPAAAPEKEEMVLENPPAMDLNGRTLSIDPPMESPADPIEEYDESKNNWFMEHYKSKTEMLDDEKIETLQLHPLDISEKKVLDDPKKYELPTEKTSRFHIERDLRKIKIGLLRLHTPEPRKLAKLGILKHYDLLTAIYKKYCKMGGDQVGCSLYSVSADLESALDHEVFINIEHRVRT